MVAPPAQHCCKHLGQSNEKTFRTLPGFIFVLLFFAPSEDMEKTCDFELETLKISEPTC